MTNIPWLFDAGIRAREESRESPTKWGRWRASDAGKCEIAQLMKAYEVEPDPINAELLFKFQMCSNIEDFVVETLTMALADNDSVEVFSGASNAFSDNELGISGHADVVIREMATGKITDLIEVKALNCFFFKKFEKEPIEQVYFYGQLQTYAHMAGLDSVSLVIVERNTPSINHYIVPFDQYYWNWLSEMYNRLNAYYDAAIFPSVREVQGEMACKFCSYYGSCMGGEVDLRGVLAGVEESKRQRAEAVSKATVEQSE